jgi:RNA polymerase sigma-70 factor (ECF subfamily)
MEPSDATLVSRALAGDPTAYETIVRRHFRAVYAVALALTGRPQDAEDVCQDALVKGYQRLADCRTPERVGGWLMEIARNRAHNYREYQRLRQMPRLEEFEHHAGTESPSRDAERAQLRERLLAALGAVSAVQREVVLLHDLEGWKHGEIAQALSISELMSRRHLSDARKTLRRLLADQPAPGDSDD